MKMSLELSRTIEAWKNWERIAAQQPDIARRFAPRLNADWRKIDKAIAKVRAARLIRRAR